MVKSTCSLSLTYICHRIWKKKDLLSFNTHHWSFLLNTLGGLYRKNTTNGESDFMKFVFGIRKGFISHLIKLLILIFSSSQWRLFLQKRFNSKIEYNVDIIAKVLEITSFQKKGGVHGVKNYWIIVQRLNWKYPIVLHFTHRLANPLKSLALMSILSAQTLWNNTRHFISTGFDTRLHKRERTELILVKRIYCLS